MHAPQNLYQLISLDDIKNKNITLDVDIVLSKSYSNKIEMPAGNLSEYISIKSYLVPLDNKDKLLKEFTYDSDFIGGGNTYFDDEIYHTGEQFNYGEFVFEIICNDRLFPPLDLGYYEPTDRLVKYLNLHREGNNWCNPCNKEIIIKIDGTSRGTSSHDTYITIRKSELIDYLAARKCGLLILRYAERQLITKSEIPGFPDEYRDMTTKHGIQSFYVDRDDQILYFSRLWDSFWIDPASMPRRYDAPLSKDAKRNVAFTLSDGEISTYEECCEKYFEVVSFNPTLILGILSKPNTSILFHSLNVFDIRFNDGHTLDCCINRHGQIQSFFGMVNKLDEKNQRYLSGFSESKKAELDDDFINIYIEGKFPDTRPISWTISKCLEEVNKPWLEKYNESILLSPKEEDIPKKLKFGPISDNLNELVDMMLEVQKVIIPEGNINQIKKCIDCSALSNPNDYLSMKSIAYSQLLFKKYSKDGNEGDSIVLKIINDLRNCKGHPINIEIKLKKYDLDNKSIKDVYNIIISSLYQFILDYRIVTEQIFGIKLNDIKKSIDDPWYQLKIAKNNISYST